MNLTNYLISFTLIVLCFSCRKEIPFPDADHKPLIVINSLFSPGGELNVHVSESCHIKDQNCVNNHINDADVVLKNETGVVLGDLSFSENGLYVYSGEITPNSKYKIEVSHADYEPKVATAENLVPKMFDCKFLGQNEGQISGTQNWIFDVEIEDDPNVENFYLLEGTIEPINGNSDDDGSGNEINGYDFPRYAHYTNDVNAENNEISAGFDIVIFPLRSIFLKDENFNGQTYQTSFGVNYLEVYQGEFEDYRAHLSIKSVSREMYEYYKSLELLRLGNGNIFAEPELIYTNVSGGLGIFSSYTENTFEIDLPVSEYRLPNWIDIENEGCQAPCAVSFSTNGGDKLNYNWIFGDGETSTEPNPEHTYNAAGTYEYELLFAFSNGDNINYTGQVIIQ